MMRLEVQDQREPFHTMTTESSTYVLEIDGEQWEVSESAFNECGQSHRLYPRLVTEETFISIQPLAVDKPSHQDLFRGKGSTTKLTAEELEEEKITMKKIDYSKLQAEDEPDLKIVRKRPPPPSMTLSPYSKDETQQQTVPQLIHQPIPQPTPQPPPEQPASSLPSSIPTIITTTTASSTPYERCDSVVSWSSDESEAMSENGAGLMIEIVPGMEVMLRGSAETKRAMRKGQVIRASCIDCSLAVGCIADAEYVLCPLCKSVSPLAFSVNTSRQTHGVGLGFEL